MRLLHLANILPTPRSLPSHPAQMLPPKKETTGAPAFLHRRIVPTTFRMTMKEQAKPDWFQIVPPEPWLSQALLDQALHCTLICPILWTSNKPPGACLFVLIQERLALKATRTPVWLFRENAKEKNGQCFRPENKVLLISCATRLWLWLYLRHGLGLYGVHAQSQKLFHQMRMRAKVARALMIPRTKTSRATQSNQNSQTLRTP